MNDEALNKIIDDMNHDLIRLRERVSALEDSAPARSNEPHPTKYIAIPKSRDNH